MLASGRRLNGFYGIRGVDDGGDGDNEPHSKKRAPGTGRQSHMICGERAGETAPSAGVAGAPSPTVLLQGSALCWTWTPPLLPIFSILCAISTCYTLSK